ncbi:hypothetical protein V6L77_07430 [Pannonibacter sp. Pt2-lr]
MAHHRARLSRRVRRLRRAAGRPPAVPFPAGTRGLARGIAAAALDDGRSLTLVGVGGADSALRRCASGGPVAAEAVQRWQDMLAQAADLLPVPEDAAEGSEPSDAVLLLALANSLAEREALRSQHDWRSERRKLGEARKTQALSELASAAAGHTIEAAVTRLPPMTLIRCAPACCASLVP